jgi:hypothetical protein
MIAGVTIIPREDVAYNTAQIVVHSLTATGPSSWAISPMESLARTTTSGDLSRRAEMNTGITRMLYSRLWVDNGMFYKYNIRW